MDDRERLEQLRVAVRGLVGCPRCGAGRGDPCVGVRRGGAARLSNHVERLQRVEQLPQVRELRRGGASRRDQQVTAGEGLDLLLEVAEVEAAFGERFGR